MHCGRRSRDSLCPAGHRQRFPTHRRHHVTLLPVAGYRLPCYVAALVVFLPPHASCTVGFCATHCSSPRCLRSASHPPRRHRVRRAARASNAPLSVHFRDTGPFFFGGPIRPDCVFPAVPALPFAPHFCSYHSRSPSASAMSSWAFPPCGPALPRTLRFIGHFVDDQRVRSQFIPSVPRGTAICIATAAAVVSTIARRETAWVRRLR